MPRFEKGNPGGSAPQATGGPMTGAERREEGEINRL